MLEFARPKLTSKIDSADFHDVSDNMALKPIYFKNHFNTFFNPHGLIVEKNGAALGEMRLPIQA